MHRARVVLLGTGGALNVERSQAAIVVEAGATRVLLDVGGGLDTVRRLRAAGLDPASIGHVFLSHRHLDHVGGLEPFLLTVAFDARLAGTPPPAVRLYATAETATAVRATLEAADASGPRRLGERLAWQVVAPGPATALEPGARLTAVLVDHLPAGGGAAACVLDLDGVRVAYSGDTRPSPVLAEAARGVDLLVHEVGGLDDRADAVHALGHSTAADAGRIATRAGARALALTHVPASVVVPATALLAEARRFAPDLDVFVAEDGMARAL